MSKCFRFGCPSSPICTGNVTLALQEANSVASTILNQVNDIGQYYYGLENKTVLSSIPTQFQNLLPTNVASGVANNSGIVVVNADNQLTTRATTKIKNLWGLIDLNGGDLGNDKITIAKLNPTVSSLEITNESNNTTTYQFPNATLDINITSINSGKNKLSILLSNGNEEYLYFYKGRYDAEDDNNSLNGNTDYYFHDIKADNVVANDMFVLVENFNDATRNDDDRWIYMLPNDQNQIDVLHLNASGGYRVDSINYEQYVVSNTNAANAGQDIRTTSSINVRKIDSTKSITGTFLKVVENSQIPFTLSDLNTESIWLHAHYYNPNATYSAVCTDGSLKCDQNSSGNVWVGAQDLHLTLGEYQNQSANYNLANSTYSINNLANDRGYRLLAFWREKNILGWEYDVNSSINNNVVLGGETKDINGTLADPFTHIKIARKTMFSGQPYYSYSTVTKKDTNNIFSINYHLDTTGTTSYLIYGDVNSTLDFASTCGTTPRTNCTQIKIGGVGGTPDASTDLTIPPR